MPDGQALRGTSTKNMAAPSLVALSLFLARLLITGDNDTRDGRKRKICGGPVAAVMLGGMATYIGEAALRLRVKDVVVWLQRFPEEAIVYASPDEPPAIVVRDKDNRRHLASLPAPQPPSPQ